MSGLGWKAGRLIFAQHSLGAPTWTARLLDDQDHDLIPLMTNASVKSIDDRGILLRGLEQRSVIDRSEMQAWWCVFDTV